MIRKIADILAEKRPTFSFEVFPPKTPKGMRNLFKTIEKLAELEPDYISVTYGAGGSTSKSTLDIIRKIQERFGLTCMHHFTLVNQTIDELTGHIREMLDAGVRNVLALRGDPPPEMGDEFHKVDGGIEYCYELIDLVKKIGPDSFSIAAAGFPEGHVDCPSKDLDSRYLKTKLDHGAAFVVTQLFFENEIYSEYLERTEAVGAVAPVIPGLLPIIDYNRLLKFCDVCGASIPQKVHDIFKPMADDKELTVKTGTEFAIDQAKDLLERGAPGIHFYCLNKVEPVRTIWKALKGM
ncbi:MAG: methylenetetrahydrofolate reductase [Planctomycetes bacterium]|nr:methylenetetrahydrofolate reductase [Planctomycetota bacterium]